MQKALSNILFLIAFLFIIFQPLNANNKTELLSCIIHLHSTFSGSNKVSLNEIVKRTKAKNIDVVIPTDHDLMRWEYGIWPLRKIIKKTIKKNSVLKTGPEKYLNEIKELDALYPEIIIIPGIESGPFYFWTGNPFKEKLTLNQWHKHMLVIGMENLKDYYQIPNISNPTAGGFKIVLLWPLLLILSAFLLKKFRAFFIIFGLLSLFYNYPFTSVPYNQYNGPHNEKPYQKLIDYANDKNTLTYWAHPEAINWEKGAMIDSIIIKTKTYPKSIINTNGFTGFSIFAEGYREVGSPEGYWDQSLVEYCKGKRKKPVWAIGELDFSNEDDIIDRIQNILWVKKKTKDSVLESLKQGNSYALWKHNDWNLNLNKFFISSGKEKAICGQQIKYEYPVKIHLSIAASDFQKHKIKIKIIRNGKLYKIIEGTAPLQIIYQDKKFLPKGKNYYRVMIEGNYPHKIALNPVFLQN